ncbi:hypothetical protein Cgig2_029445 [Carnegiea gigantea]|uniref:CCHC-type domain-containing protein n=1 Tax=Carnegiea gigantea TaxID=171969 RepID=A0A9Q1JXP7_9CARY|nr:hypothetical protein Cgig2_029445 [Carnegiea gigantea]
MVNPEERLSLKFVEALVINGFGASIRSTNWWQLIKEFILYGSTQSRIRRQCLAKVQFPKLDVKYWGVESLSKLGSLLGIPLKSDKPTMEKVYLNHARLLIDAPFDGPFPEYVDYITNKGLVTRQRVKYEWRPLKCTHCNMFGHVETDCKKKQSRQSEWRVVPQRVPVTH